MAIKSGREIAISNIQALETAAKSPRVTASASRNMLEQAKVLRLRWGLGSITTRVVELQEPTKVARPVYRNSKCPLEKYSKVSNKRDYLGRYLQEAK